MNAEHRLPNGGTIDRSRPIHFLFDGKRIDALAGDTVASALLANGIKIVGRSFKFHRPRGILGHGVEECNALVDIDWGGGRREPNCRATNVLVEDGMVVKSQNCWPSRELDVGALSGVFAPLLKAGFYYKTFMWPRSFWRRVYEPAIRAAAGLGKAPLQSDPDRYETRYQYCDVLVIGAGIAGIAAAHAAAKAGSKVILVDEQFQLGGNAAHDQTTKIGDLPIAHWLKNEEAELRGMGLEVYLNTTAFGYYNHNLVALSERPHQLSPRVRGPREIIRYVRARRVILAAGAHERPLIFPDNDRPGVMLSDSVRAYINRYAVLPGSDVVVITNGPSAYQCAIDVLHAGSRVILVDVRQRKQCGSEVAEAEAKGIKIFFGHTVVKVIGKTHVSGLTIAPSVGESITGPKVMLRCDCIAMCGGWTPAVHLYSQSRGTLTYDNGIQAFVPSLPAQSIVAVGACNGAYSIEDCINEGMQAGQLTGWSQKNLRPSSIRLDEPMPTPVLPGREGWRNPAFVDFQNDVTSRDIELAHLEGFESVEHLKRYTTTGMATDQGKTSNLNALTLLAQLSDRHPAAVGTTTFRPPYTPVTLGALAGAEQQSLFEPLRKTPIDDWAERRGAVFEPVGLWRRARYFPRYGEDLRAAVRRECRAVRQSVGIFDASTLGKIEVVGPDAHEFMNRIYVNAWTKLEPGKCRYGLLLKDDGFILDDGVVARLAPDRFHVTTTTGGAARVYAHMEEYRQTEWPELRVYITSITEQWSVISVQGPDARKVIQSLINGIDLRPEAFPHMTVRTGTIAGVPTRLFRVSFTGELGFEINVPPLQALDVWQAILIAGDRYGIVPYGTEATHVLRAEKGYIIVGQETDGTVTPSDVGLGSLIAKTKRDFVGKRSLQRPDLVSPNRKVLVGLLPSDPSLVVDEGAQVVGASRSNKSIGHVTSSYWSDACGRSIALALVAGGQKIKGETVLVTAGARFERAVVVDPVFFDLENRRVNS